MGEARYRHNIMKLLLMNYFLRGLCCLLAAIFAAWVGPAQGDLLSADDVARLTHDRDSGNDSLALIEMKLIDRSGTERVRQLEMAEKKYGALTKRYIYFHEPRAIKGTAFLSWENSERGDDQFLYLPSLGRARRIVANQKDRSFVNTDYSFEDLERQKLELFTNKILGEESFLGKACYLLERVPKKKSDSQYGRMVSWIAKDLFLPLKVEYYDRSNKLVKVFTARSFKQVDGIWLVTDSIFRTLGKNHQTELLVKQVKFNSGLSDRIFSETYLERRD